MFIFLPIVSERARRRIAERQTPPDWVPARRGGWPLGSLDFLLNEMPDALSYRQILELGGKEDDVRPANGSADRTTLWRLSDTLRCGVMGKKYLVWLRSC